MPERLISRFAGGLVAQLDKPNVELCADIIRMKMRRDGLDIPEDVVQYVARTYNGSVREIEEPSWDCWPTASSTAATSP